MPVPPATFSDCWPRLTSTCIFSMDPCNVLGSDRLLVVGVNGPIRLCFQSRVARCCTRYRHCSSNQLHLKGCRNYRGTG